MDETLDDDDDFSDDEINEEAIKEIIEESKDKDDDKDYDKNGKYISLTTNRFRTLLVCQILVSTRQSIHVIKSEVKNQ